MNQQSVLNCETGSKFLFQLLPELMKSRQFMEFVSFQFIIVTVDMLDQYSTVDCDSVFKKRSFHWNGSFVSYSIFCIN